MNELIIRPATRADVPAITAIYAPAVLHGTATFELEPPGEAEMLQRMIDIAGAGFPYLAAERAGEVLGYAYVDRFRTRPAFRFVVEDSIYVARDAQGEGIGRALLDALIAQSATRGLRQMIAVIGDSRQLGSIALHRSAGFAFSGTLQSVGFKFDRWIDCVLMQRPLGPGDTTPALETRPAD